MESQLIEIGRKLAALGLDAAKAFDVLQLVVDAAEKIADERYQDQRTLDELRERADGKLVRRRRTLTETKRTRGKDRAPRKRADRKSTNGGTELHAA